MAAGGDPNDWYRHDHGPDGTDDPTRAGKRLSTGKDGAAASAANGVDKPLWFASDGVWHDKAADGEEAIGKASTFSPKYVINSPVFQHLPEPNRACLVGDW